MSIYSITAKFNPELSILKLLNDSPDGLNIKMISKEVGIHCSWVVKHLDSLVAKSKLKSIRVGKSKVFYVG